MAAGVGPPRAAVAGPEHGARRLLGRARQHPGPPQPLVAARRSWTCWRATAGCRRRARRSPGRCCSCASARSGARHRGPLGRDRNDGPRHLRLLLARQPLPVGVRLRPDHAAVVGGVHHRVGAVPPGRAAAVAHHRRPRRARTGGHRAPARGGDDPARPGAAVRRAGRAVSGADPGRPLRRLVHAVLDPRRRPCWPTRCRTSRAASSRATAASGCTAGSCSWSPAPGSRSPWRWRWARRPASRWWRWACWPPRWCRWRWSRGPRAGGIDGTGGSPMPAEEPAAEAAEFTLAHGGGFAAAVLVIMLAEQTFLNAGPLLVNATEGASGAALAGFTFNVLLMARAPLQLFQAVQTSILPHLTRLDARGQTDPFRRSLNVTLVAIAGFAAVVALVMLVAGPGADGARVRRRLRLRPRRAGADRGRHGPVPGRGHSQPGAAGTRARPGGVRVLGRGRHGVPGLPPAAGLRRRRPAGRDRLRGRGAGAGAGAVRGAAGRPGRGRSDRPE